MIGQGIYPNGIKLVLFIKCPLINKFIGVKDCRGCPVNGGLQGNKETYQVCFHYPRVDPTQIQTSFNEVKT